METKSEWSIIEDATNAMMIAYREHDTDCIQEILWDASRELMKKVEKRWKDETYIIFPDPEEMSRRGIEETKIVIQPCPQARLEITKYINERFIRIIRLELQERIMEKLIAEALKKKEEQYEKI